MHDRIFLEKFEKDVKNTISSYKLASKRDRIAVACSGGKDSTTALYLLKKFGYNVFAIYIDLKMGDYSKKCLDNIKKFCKEHKINLHIISMQKEFGSSMCYIRSNIQESKKISNCTICGVIKRWLLNKKARQLKATKLATGHNLDDEAQTILINFFKGNVKLGLNSGPATGIVEDRKFVTRIKPLYFSPEDDIRKYSEMMKFPVNYERCPCAVGTYRIETRGFLNHLQEKDSIEMNVIKNFLLILPRLRDYFIKDDGLTYCKKCGEPSRQDICKVCSLLK